MSSVSDDQIRGAELIKPINTQDDTSHEETFFDALLNENPEKTLEKKNFQSSAIPFENSPRGKTCMHRLQLNHKIFWICLIWFIVMTAFGAFVFIYSLNLDHERLQTELHQSCSQNIDSVKSVLIQLANNLESYIYLIHSVKKELTREMFESFTDLAIRNSYDYTVGWYELVPHEKRADWEEANNCTISVLEFNKDNSFEFWPSDTRSWYLPLQDMLGVTRIFKGLDILQTLESSIIEQTLTTGNTSVGWYIDFKMTRGKAISLYIPLIILAEDIVNSSNPFLNGPTNHPLGLFAIAVSTASVAEKIHNFIDFTEKISMRVVNNSNNTILYTSNVGYNYDSHPSPISAQIDFCGEEWSIECYIHNPGFLTSKTHFFLLLSIIFCIVFSTILLFVFTKRYLRARKQVFLGNQLLHHSNALVKNMATNSKAILLTITDPLLLFDRAGKITGANTYALSRTGYTSEDISKSTNFFIGEVISISKKPNDVSHLVIEPGMREVTVTCKDGTQFYAEANFSAQTVIGSNYAQVVTFRDISAKKEAAIALWNAKNKAERADKSKGDILLYLCHEIRNPVHAISGYAKLLMDQRREQEEEDEDHRSEEMENILCSAKFLSELVNEVLDLANLHDNDLVLNEKVISLSELLASTDHLTSSAEGSKYQLSSTLIDSDSVSVICDPSALELVVHRLGRLLSNSSCTDQNEEAVMKLEIALVEEDEEYAVIEYSIRCPNKVIPTHYLAVDFDPLAQGNGSVGDQFGMKGISLTLTRIMIQKLGGKLISTSDSEAGTHFSFSLKFRKPAGQHSIATVGGSMSRISNTQRIDSSTAESTRKDELSTKEKILKKGKSKTPHAKQKKALKKNGSPPLKMLNDLSEPLPVEHRGRIILAEDNLICQKLAVKLLTKNGYDVTTANNGLEAVQAVESSPDYDIALLDIHMPVMGGLEAGQAMRERLGFKGQIVALTANTTSEYRQACVDAGFDAFAPKPIKEQELITILSTKSRMG